MSAEAPPAKTLVFVSDWRGDDERPMRVVITPDNHVHLEELVGTDALGVPRWMPLDLYAETKEGYPEMSAGEWAEVVALAVARCERVEVTS